MFGTVNIVFTGLTEYKLPECMLGSDILFKKMCSAEPNYCNKQRLMAYISIDYLVMWREERKNERKKEKNKKGQVCMRTVAMLFLQ